MRTKTLLLWLEGPLQSWGGDVLPYDRTTQSFPTRSAIYGLVFSACGWFGPQEERLAAAASCPLRIAGYQSADALPFSDFQSVGVGYDQNDDWEDRMIPKRSDGKRPAGVAGGKVLLKHYLTDCRFAAFVGVPDAWEADVRAAIVSPAGPLYLGRKSCVPGYPPLLGLFDAEEAAEKALEHFLQDRAQFRAALARRFEVVETQEEDESSFKIDVPLAFGKFPKKKGRRIRIVLSDL